MSVQPISEITTAFKSNTAHNSVDNVSYKKHKSGVAGGFLTGLGLSALLFCKQVKSLATISGKKNLISSLHEKGKSLNDVMPRCPERSKAIINKFKKNLIFVGLATVAFTTAVGRVIDWSINKTREKRASEDMHIS